MHTRPEETPVFPFTSFSQTQNIPDNYLLTSGLEYKRTLAEKAEKTCLDVQAEITRVLALLREVYKDITGELPRFAILQFLRPPVLETDKLPFSNGVDLIVDVVLALCVTSISPEDFGSFVQTEKLPLAYSQDRLKLVTL